MKLIIVCGTLESGGAERVISILSTPFAQAFSEVQIIMWRDAPVFYKIDSRVNIISLPKLAQSNSDLKKIIAFRRFIKSQHPDLILSFLTLFNLFTLLSLIGINLPIIVAERNDPRFIKGGKIVSVIRDSLYKKASGILCQTQSIKDCFKKSLEKKCHIIYNPISLDSNLIGAALKHPKENEIVSIGRLRAQKNQKLLIDAFEIFLTSHPNYRLVIYGKGELKSEIQDYIKEKNLENKIELAGENPQVMDAILDAKAFVLTSKYEGMPNALIESMCLGLPCISTKVSGAVDLIIDKKNGFLVDDNPEIIATRLAEIVDYPAKGELMGSEASKIYEELKSDYISEQWITYILEKINSHRSK